MEKMEVITNKFPKDLKNDSLLTAAEICYDEGIITYDEFNYVMKYLNEVND